MDYKGIELKLTNNTCKFCPMCVRKLTEAK